MTEAVAGNVALKEANAAKLYGLLAFNIAIFYLATHADLISARAWAKLLAGWPALAVGGVGVALVSILNGQISSDTKAKLVFLRRHNPYPGSRAFTEFGPKDMAVDMAALEKRYGPLPYAPKDQNVLWYRMYRAVAGLPGVAQAHRHFLFSRDYSFMSLLMLVVLGALALVMMRPWSSVLFYLPMLMAQWALATNAANIGGHRLVTVVLAQNAAGH
ncbi:MAG TPA: hypothetical protein VGH23_16450 [Rhizomicrobium sp.]|jgi:hypothetical protein